MPTKDFLDRRYLITPEELRERRSSVTLIDLRDLPLLLGGEPRGTTREDLAALGEEADGLFLALPGLDPTIDLVAKIPSQIGVRVPQRLILANEAPEFLDQGFISRLLFGVRKVADFDRMTERHREAGQKADKDQVS